MDVATLPISHLEVLAARLERCADDVDGLAARTRHGTSPSWRGEAADRYEEVVAGHEADLTTLGGDLRDAATDVRMLAVTARERLAALVAAAEVVWDEGRPIGIIP